MIVEAITELKDRGGSSAISIKKWVEHKYGKQIKDAGFSKRLNAVLKNAGEKGTLVRNKNSFKLSEVRTAAMPSCRLHTCRGSAASFLVVPPRLCAPAHAAFVAWPCPQELKSKAKKTAPKKPAVPKKPAAPKAAAAEKKEAKPKKAVSKPKKPASKPKVRRPGRLQCRAPCGSGCCGCLAFPG
jgi:histone H1/5